MSNNHFEKNFDYGSFFPTLLIILGFYIIYLLINDNNSQAFFIMMISFLVYVANNVIINITGFSTVFNEYLEDMGSFLTFGITTIIFGLLFFKGNVLFLFIIFFYATSLVLALARNWILKLKNSLGWPIALNGIFFPLIYYIYIFYLQGPGDSIFVLYYIGIAILSISKYNFLGYNENTHEKFKVVETRIYEKYKDKFKHNNSNNNVDLLVNKEDNNLGSNNINHIEDINHTNHTNNYKENKEDSENIFLNEKKEILISKSNDIKNINNSDNIVNNDNNDNINNIDDINNLNYKNKLNGEFNQGFNKDNIETNNLNNNNSKDERFKIILNKFNILKKIKKGNSQENKINNSNENLTKDNLDDNLNVDLENEYKDKDYELNNNSKIEIINSNLNSNLDKINELLNNK